MSTITLLIVDDVPANSAVPGELPRGAGFEKFAASAECCREEA